MSFTCPRCGLTSHHPEDERQGYCGHCHDWTRPAPERPRFCAGCGTPLDDDEIEVCPDCARAEVPGG